MIHVIAGFCLSRNHFEGREHLTERFTPRIREVAWKHARALPSNCPGCVEADRPSTLFVEMKGGYLSLCCDVFHMKWWHCHARNSRTRASPRWVRARRVSAARGTGTSWGPAPSPRSPAAAWGGHLGFTTQLLFIKHESIVMLQNSEDCWAVQCRKHCCYGNQSCIIFVCFCNKTQYIYISICALLLLDCCTFEKHCSAFYLGINSLISDWVGIKMMIIIIPDAFLVAFVNLLMVPAQ